MSQLFRVLYKKPCKRKKDGFVSIALVNTDIEMKNMCAGLFISK